MRRAAGVAESAAGQAVTIYALGTALTAIPLSAATATWRRKRLLLAGVAGFAVANTVTALSADYLLTMVARFVAGVAAGVVWALLAGHARRLAPAHRQGKAIAIVMAGIPLALSLGIPAGTFLGGLLGWRSAFGVMSVLAVVLLAWITAAVPDQPGQAGGRVPVLRTLTVLSTLLVAVAALLLAVFAGSPVPVYAAVALWGLGWGGVPTLLQTAAGNAGGEAADNAQAMLVTLWNAAMAAGGVAGGVLLDAAGPAAFPWTLLVLLVPVLALVLGARRHGFPA
ncbi:MFS transporter [Amycolatopsis vastitatis]|uniref:MFS transporter n=1 Tax=Amycolatopsis vastitatis TaxID=1905142 RepID=A0A229T8N8_9PSEU|nr:MFS transporter [Amycolatopsis vastitatis]OXM67607.1 MFS transporter [Amycolatopsis vastitatis]